MDGGGSLGAFWEKIHAAHKACPDLWQLRSRTERWHQQLLAVLFPHYWQEGLGPCDAISGLIDPVQTELACLIELTGEEGFASKASAFWNQVPAVYDALLQDAQALERHDPAAESVEEVILAYPGFLAVASHRLSHVLYRLDVALVPRLIAEWAHRQTGIDIHPGASIGVPFVIDHGTGVVVGETTVIGKGVKLYQGVTLGAVSVKKELAEVKRHPTLEDDVVVYAGATILGGKTTIGQGSVIGGGAFLTASIPSRTVVTRTNEVRPLGNGALSEFLAFGENI
jgi:serine O-acetyltransferase